MVMEFSTKFQQPPYIFGKENPCRCITNSNIRNVDSSDSFIVQPIVCRRIAVSLVSIRSI